MDPLWFLDDYEERMLEFNKSNDDEGEKETNPQSLDTDTSK